MDQRHPGEKKGEINDTWGIIKETRGVGINQSRAASPENRVILPVQPL